MTVETELMTRGSIIQSAVDNDLGTPEVLASRFNEWSRIGVIGSMVRKESRRGGAGLWQWSQGAIFRKCLAMKQAGKSTRELFAVPVFFWLFQIPGIPTRQVQRAWYCWAYDGHLSNDPDKPNGGRFANRRGSNGARSLRAWVDGLSDAKASRRDKCQAVKYLVNHLQIGQVTADGEQFLACFSHVVPGDSQEKMRQDVQRLTDIYHALTNADKLAIETMDVQRFWEWAGERFREKMREYFKGDINEIPFFYPQTFVVKLDFDDFLRLSCVVVSTILGRGIQDLRKVYYEDCPPPSVRVFCEGSPDATVNRRAFLSEGIDRAGLA